jgi:LacI family transcriptional regulator
MTYNKIAKSAHVSLSTVSKALSGSKEISEDLAKKIIDIAIEQGYFENKHKRKIQYTKNKALTIAIICPEIISFAYARDITAIKNEIDSRDGLTSIYVYDFSIEKLNQIIKTITVRNCADGIILFPIYDEFKRTSIPMVAISQNTSDIDSVFHDMYSCFDDIIGYLKSLGHKDIAFVGETYTMSKFYAYNNSLKKFGLPFKEDNVYIINERFEQIGYHAVEQMLKKRHLPTAVICAYDEIALAMIHSLSAHNIKIPQQISIVGINDIPASEYAQVPLTTVRIFQEEQGEIAINLLYDKIFNGSKNIQHITVNHELIKRNSTDKCLRL